MLCKHKAPLSPYSASSQQQERERSEKHTEGERERERERARNINVHGKNNEKGSKRYPSLAAPASAVLEATPAPVRFGLPSVGKVMVQSFAEKETDSGAAFSLSSTTMCGRRIKHTTAEEPKTPQILAQPEPIFDLGSPKPSTIVHCKKAARVLNLNAKQ